MKPINLLSIGMASDHAGYALKQTIKQWLEAQQAVSYTHLTLPTTPYV